MKKEKNRIKIDKNMFKNLKMKVKVNVSKYKIIQDGDKICVDNGIEKKYGTFIRQTNRSFAGSIGEYLGEDEKIHIYDEFCHTISKLTT